MTPPGTSLVQSKALKPQPPPLLSRVKVPSCSIVNVSQKATDYSLKIKSANVESLDMTERHAEAEDNVRSGREWAGQVRDPWWPCILTLDGGGIRGYSSLLILEVLMHEIWEVEQEHGGLSDCRTEKDLLPCRYFDFMYGTSTGGLIATLLGRLRQPVSEALELYRRVGNDLFGKKRSYIPFTSKYHHQPLERAVKEVVSSQCVDHPNCDGEHDLLLWNTKEFQDIIDHKKPFDVNEPRVCQTACLTAKNDYKGRAHLLRSYPFYYSPDAPNWATCYNQGIDKLPIWKVARATTAAPFYFKMVRHEVDGEKMMFKDGGIRENNPSWAAYNEFTAMYCGKATEPALLLSVGAGRPDQSKDGFSHKQPRCLDPLGRKALEKMAVATNMVMKYTEGETQHLDMRTHAAGEHTWYKRLNAGGLEKMPLDDWRKGLYGGEKVAGGETLSQMEKVTKDYLSRGFDPDTDDYAPPQVMLRQVAEKLVRQRREREALGGERWTVYNYGYDESIYKEETKDEDGDVEYVAFKIEN
ncbi:FabD/lysophospholipase-like protein [Piedraia hortae CBS 480.64]|uniref:FabD/lysophospholipase-like protein n=1 Tax=Piedraia hortae CBS 480.64 TaxID=1314780 RepID=A0A6A7C581_9PEZI|nr:FabD/lysophospholipase-like protein [Piedraia hortae CBS 480.64]